MSDITPTKELLTVYLRQYKHNDGDGYVAAYDISIEQYISNLIDQLAAKEREVEGLLEVGNKALSMLDHMPCYQGCDNGTVQYGSGEIGPSQVET